MMPKGLCVSTYVFGPYTCYIAPYIYFLKRTYPESFPLIFTHNTLPPEEKKALELMAEDFSFDVVENCFGNVVWKKEQHGKAARWLLWDKRFMDFAGVYIGDIDILIMPEETDLLEGHLRHCERLHLPCSNIVRYPVPFPMRKDLRAFAVTAQLRGMKEALRLFMSKEGLTRRMSGLHFFIPEQYEPFFSRHKDKYRDLLLRKPYFLWHDRGFSNESFLYDFMEECGFAGSLPVQPASTDGQCTVDDDFLYRPEHGIHMAIFRSERLARRFYEQSREVLSRYYDRYLSISQEPLYREIAKSFSPLLRSEFDRMHRIMATLSEE